MSTTTTPVQTIWTIQRKQDDPLSLLALPVDGVQLGVFLFTDPEFAASFAAESPDTSHGATAVKLTRESLPAVLVQQANLGRTYVVTDPILGSHAYMEQNTATIPDYLDALAEN